MYDSRFEYTPQLDQIEFLTRYNHYSTPTFVLRFLKSNLEASEVSILANYDFCIAEQSTKHAVKQKFARLHCFFVNEAEASFKLCKIIALFLRFFLPNCKQYNISFINRSDFWRIKRNCCIFCNLVPLASLFDYKILYKIQLAVHVDRCRYVDPFESVS